MYIDEKQKFVAPGLRPLDEVSQRLLKAAALIRERGLAKNSLMSRGSLCVLGAINTAVHGAYGHPDMIVLSLRRQILEGVKLDTDIATAEAMRKRVAAQIERRFGERHRPEAIYDWNNAPERTAEEVIAALEAAALSSSDAQRSGS